MNTITQLTDFEPKTSGVLEEWLEGLSRPIKRIPSKYFYDREGSLLFDRICELKEYYPTRTEARIMRDFSDEIAGIFEEDSLLVEYGSGSSRKTRILLDNLPELSGYMPVDISKEHLIDATKAIAAAYPDLEILPVCADYGSSFELPELDTRISQRIVYFPGSTIGNFHPAEAVDFLKRIAEVCGRGGGLLIGVDLKKDPGVLHRAYNDADGVTAKFNLNLLERANRELNADFDLKNFRHYAFYNPSEGRIEMHLISSRNQSVNLSGHPIEFEEGETIWTESSYKYSLEGFRRLAEKAGFELRKYWTDPEKLFCVQYLAYQPLGGNRTA